MSKQKKNRFVIEYETVVDDYRANFRQFMPVSKAHLLEEFKNYSDALSSIQANKAKEIISYGKRRCENWLQYHQTTKDNTFDFIDSLRDRAEFPMYVDDKNLRGIFFEATQGPEGVINKYDNPMISTQAKEHEDANKAWWNLQLEKHDLALDFLDEKERIKKQGLAKGKEKSNAGVLPQASDWMNPLVTKIVNVEIKDSKEADKKICKILNDEYNGFIKDFDFTSLKTPYVSGGTRTKKSIALALMFIFSRRENGQIKEYTTITKAYPEL